MTRQPEVRLSTDAAMRVPDRAAWDKASSARGWRSLRWCAALLLSLLALWDAHSVHAQVIRSYEHLDRSAGEDYYATAVFLFDGAKGNAQFLDIDSSAAFGYRGKLHWVRFYPAYRVKRSEGETVIHNRSTHVRHSLLLTARMRTFAFVQLQSEEAIDLERRLLVGGGLRYQLFRLGNGGIDVGVGAMLDDERRTGSETRSNMRGANLATVYGDVGTVKLSGTTYFQPVFNDWQDHRILVVATGIVPLVAHFSLDVSGYWRRDARPPLGIKKHDTGLKIGFRLDVG